MNHRTTTLTILIGVILFGFHLGEAQAQLNEKKVEKSASGAYKLKMSKLKRKRQGHTFPIDDGNVKMNIPVKDGGVKSKIKDDELGGADKANLKGKEKKSTVKRGGKKILLQYAGQMDIKGDGHNPYKKGQSKGLLNRKGKSWFADLAQEAKRVDNDGFISQFSGKASGKH